jgi:hypothetical protein
MEFDKRAAFDDFYQAGCEAYLRYAKPGFFPFKAIKYYMLNEMAKLAWGTSWQGRTTLRQEWYQFIDEMGGQYKIDERCLARLDLQLLIEKAELSDTAFKAGGHTRHMRTLRWIAQFGVPEIKIRRKRISGAYNPIYIVQPAERPKGVDASTYHSACKSLRSFAKKVLK